MNQLNNLNTSNYTGLVTPVRNNIPETPAETPLIDQEIDSLKAAVFEMEDQLNWLLGKIAPVCQMSESALAGSGSDQGNKLQAAPSALRAAIASQREHVLKLATRIAGIKYTIEL